MSGITCIAEEDGNVYHLNIGIRELRLHKGYRLNIAGYENPGSVTVEKWEQPWTGQGLPPVGIDCETLWNSTTGEYVAVRVVGHDEDRAVVRFIGSDRKGEYDSDRQHNQYGYPIFRPMRSAEDRAAEQALREIEQLYAEGGPAAVYDAGYRK